MPKESRLTPGGGRVYVCSWYSYGKLFRSLTEDPEAAGEVLSLSWVSVIGTKGEGSHVTNKSGTLKNKVLGLEGTGGGGF